MTQDSRPFEQESISVATQGAVVARIPYLNAEPFYVCWQDLPAASRDLVPRQLGQEARAGHVDAGLMAVVDFFSLKDRFERIGNFGIATHGLVESVLLLAATPVEELGSAKVFLTQESSTSVELTRLILERRFRLGGLVYERAEISELHAQQGAPKPGEAWLVIGDAALAYRQERPECVALDLGQAWKEWTGFPFVYAVWVVRRTLTQEHKRSLHQFLERSLSQGEQEMVELAARYATAHQNRFGSAKQLSAYLHRFLYRLGPSAERGLSHFEELLEETRREQ